MAEKKLKKLRPYKGLHAPPPKQKRDFDKKLFENLCFVQCTVKEMEFILSTDSRILDSWCQRTYKQNFNDAYDKFSSGGKASLRRSQFRLANKNASMGIWLGKQYLGQEEVKKHEVVITDEDQIVQPDIIEKLRLE